MAEDIKRLKKPPIVAPGAEVADTLHNGLYIARSKNCTVGTGASADTLPCLLFAVPKNTFIYDVIVNVTATIGGTGNTGNATFIAGYSGDSDAFVASTTYTAVGCRSMHAAGGVKSGGYLTTADDYVEASWANSTAGAFHAYLVFKPYGDKTYVHNP